MKRKKGLGVWVLPLLSSLVMFMMYLTAMNENEAWKSMKNIWENGSSTEAAVQRIDNTKQRFNIRFDYSVDGTEYSGRTALSDEDFSRMDGADGDGKGTAEVHYNPQKPKNAVLEGALAYQEMIVDKRLYLAKGFVGITLGCLAGAAALKIFFRKKY